MKNLFAAAGMLATGLALTLPVLAHHDDDSYPDDGFTLAVYGDAPYGCKAPTAAAAPDECPVGSAWRPDSPEGPNPGDPRQIEATPAFIHAINRDRKVELVLFTGDTHSGSGYCTVAANRRFWICGVSSATRSSIRPVTTSGPIARRPRKVAA